MKKGLSTICQRAIYLSLMLLSFAHPGWTQVSPPTEETIPQTETDKPAGQRVQLIQVAGATLLTEIQIAEITNPFVGQELNMTTIDNLLKEIIAAYRKEGFFLVKAYLPEQEIKEGKVVISVLEGKIGEVSVTGNEYYSTSFIGNHFILMDSPVLSRLDWIKRSVLILNDYTDLKSEVVFQPGSVSGTTNMQIRVKDYQPAHLLLDYNNFGSKLVSRNRWGLGVDLGNLFSEGHLLSLRSVLGWPTRNMTYIRGGYMAPLGYEGHKLHVSYARGDFDVGREFERLNIHLKTESVGVSVTYPFLKTGLMDLTGEVGLSGNDLTQTTLQTISNRDRIRVLKGSLSLNRASPDTRDYFSFQLSQGLGKILGGMGRGASSVSRIGADGRFTKGTLEWVRIRTVPQPFWMRHPFSLILAGGGQVSSDNLVVGEQFSLGGPDSVRGYPVGEFLGDHGYRVSSELRISPFEKAEHIQGAFFFDHGGSFVKELPSVAKNDHYLTGIGFGFRFHFPGSITLREAGEEEPGYLLDYQFQIRADVGYPMDPRPSSTRDSPVYTLQAVGRF